MLQQLDYKDDEQSGVRLKPVLEEKLPEMITSTSLLQKPVKSAVDETVFAITSLLNNL